MSTPRRSVTSEDQKNDVLAKINYYTQHGFPEATRLHELIMQANPALCPRLWYGMPGYAKTKDSAVLCFFRKDTLISFGVTESVDIASLAEENQSIFPSAWYITELSDSAEQTIRTVVAKATL